ncbi:MAG: lytic murein transglycosylase B [Rhodocyclaceae bacterium]|nr:lytic murein transglycosylase B [Rhodocyclaceae bacterium]
MLLTLARLAPPVFALVALTLSSPAPAASTYADHPAALDFARQMQTDHHIAADEVMATLSRIEPDPRVIRLITPAKRKGVRSWARYRRQFIEPLRINRGLAFWREHATALATASQTYGIPAEIIVAIIGIETIYGGNTGDFLVASALATLAFDYPPRAPLFRGELENLFLLAREQGRTPLSYEGSYAGAMGYPQFLPSSIRNYAVDFDGNGRIDLEGSPVDAIGSVAHYLAVHGWEKDGPVVIRAHVEDPDRAATLVAAGIDPVFSENDFSAHQVLPLAPVPAGERAALIDLETPDEATEYWLGFRNFYVITRYNRSSFYAMAVHDLARALYDARQETVLESAPARGR